MTSVADLKPGDKLSLKGKIFELQKKLNLIDIEQQNTPEYSFEPEITNYKLPHRENNFLDNMKKAEENRKERLESLKEMVMLETGADYTYKPSINKMSKSLKSDQPVYVRLNEKGKEYQANLEKKKVDAAIYDTNGRKLFVPQRVVRSNTSSSESEMGVDEYLYRDAQGRAERRQLYIEEECREIQKLATEKKINKKSELLVRRKYERELRLIFEALQNQSDIEPAELNSNPYVTITEFQKLTENVQNRYNQRTKELKKEKGCPTSAFRKNIITSSDDPYGIVERIWKILDPSEVGYLHVQAFVKICLPAMLSRGGNSINMLSASSPNVSFECNSDLSTYSDQNLLYQYLSALTDYLSDISEYSSGDKLEKTRKITPPRAVSSAPFSPGSRQDISQRVASYNEVLTQRENQTKVRMEELRYQLYEDEMRECTFRPQITEVANKLSYYPPSAVPQPDEESHSIDGSVDSGLSLPAYERLYQQKNKIPKSILEKRHPTREERELEGCTFAPHIYRPKSVPGMRKDETTTTVKPLYSKSKEGDSDSEETYQKLNEISTKNSIIELMRERQQSQSPQEAESVKPLPSQPKGIRNALEKRKQKELEEAKVFEFNEERYLKHKQELATEGCKPFKLRTEERQQQKLKVLSEVSPSLPSPSHMTPSDTLNSPSSMKGYVRREDGELKPVRLYVEIKLGGGVKASHIAVADNDIPSELAKSFCRIYSLDSNAESILTEVVSNQMIQSGIPIGTSPGKSSKMKSKLTKDDLHGEQASTKLTPRNFRDYEREYYEDHAHQSSQRDSDR